MAAKTAAPMRDEVVLVTPEMAASLVLAHNDNNRPVSRHTVRTYVSAMQRGDWKLTHQSIAIAADGRVLDGQHRLLAVMDSGVSVRMRITRNADPATFDVIDNGRPRSPGDIAAILGIGDPVAVAAAVRLVVYYELTPERTWGGAPFNSTLHERRVMLEDYGAEVAQWANAGRRVARAIGAPRSGYTAAFTVIARVNDEELVSDFVERIAEGANLRKNDPVLTLRTNARIRTRTRQEIMALTIKTWNADVRGQEMRHLRFLTSESMPKVEPA